LVNKKNVLSCLLKGGREVDAVTLVGRLCVSHYILLSHLSTISSIHVAVHADILFPVLKTAYHTYFSALTLMTCIIPCLKASSNHLQVSLGNQFIPAWSNSQRRLVQHKPKVVHVAAANVG